MQQEAYTISFLHGDYRAVVTDSGYVSVFHWASDPLEEASVSDLVGILKRFSGRLRRVNPYGEIELSLQVGDSVFPLRLNVCTDTFSLVSSDHEYFIPGYSRLPLDELNERVCLFVPLVLLALPQQELLSRAAAAHAENMFRMEYPNESLINPTHRALFCAENIIRYYDLRHFITVRTVPYHGGTRLVFSPLPLLEVLHADSN